MAETKREKLRQHGVTTPSGITDLMARLSSGANAIATPPEPRPYNYTGTGLDIQRDLTKEEFRGGVVTELQAMNTAHQLNVGDATLYGLEHDYIEDYEEMAELTGYEASSIEVYASLCRSIPRLMRINPLTFSHYQQIAPLPEIERFYWISFAASNDLSYRALKDLIAMAQRSQLPAAASDDNTATVPAVDDAPALSGEIEEAESASLPSPIKDKVYRLRFNHLWKKVETDALTAEDLSDAVSIRMWCDQVIKDFNQRNK